METESTNRERIYVDELIPDLRALMKTGLPATLRNSGDRLPNLRNVVSRSMSPNDPMSRIDSLTTTLTEIIEGVESDHGPALAIMFGLAPGTSGTTLTARRHRAAEALQYDVDHFRKRVEVKLLWTLAEGVFKDMVRYRTGLRRSVDAFEAPRPPPNLHPRQVTEEEALLSRIWQRLYEVRAERISGLLADQAGNEGTTQEHRNREEVAAQELDQLCRRYADEYATHYIRLGEVRYSLSGLESLVVWNDDAFVEYSKLRAQGDSP